VQRTRERPPGRLRARRRGGAVPLLVVALLVAAVIGPVTRAVAGRSGSTGGSSRCVTADFPDRAAATSLTGSGWNGVWSTAVQSIAGPDLTGRTLRQVVHPTAGGSDVRIRLANTFGTRPVTFSSVRVAVAAADDSSALQSGTVHEVTFDGSALVVLEPGEEVLSDPVGLAFRFGRSLTVDLVPQGQAVVQSGHRRAIATSYLAAGDQAGQVSGGAFTESMHSWYWLAGIDVPAPGAAGSISVLGDSITEGMNSTTDLNRRWTDLLADRLDRAGTDQAGTDRVTGVLNAGIGAARLVSENPNCFSPSASGLRRFDHDVLDREDVQVVVLALGINDIGAGTPADTLIDGLSELADRAHARGLRVVAVTLTPYGCADGCLSPQKEAQRRLTNDWIRTTSVFDAVADFDAALRDPQRPERLRPAYDSGDHLHPGDAGMAAAAVAFDLDELTGSE